MKISKYTCMMAALAALASTHSRAGDKAGNGGVIFDCDGNIQLVEAWEAQDTGQPLSLGNPDAPMRDLSAEYLRRLSFFESGRAKEYGETADRILTDLEILAADPTSQDTKLVRFTNGILPFSLDSDEITQPPGCMKKQAVTQKEPEIDGERLLTIDPNIWAAMSNETRVLTIYHEINVRHSVVLGYKQTTRPARLLNRFIASPQLSSTKSVCDYMNSIINTFGMTRAKTIAYGNAEVGFPAVCSPATRRLVSAEGSVAPVYMGSLKNRSGERASAASYGGTIEFDENSNEWRKALGAVTNLDRDWVSAISGYPYRGISETLFGGRKGIGLDALDSRRAWKDGDVPLKVTLTQTSTGEFKIGDYLLCRRGLANPKCDGSYATLEFTEDASQPFVRK